MRAVPVLINAFVLFQGRISELEKRLNLVGGKQRDAVDIDVKVTPQLQQQQQQRLLLLPATAQENLLNSAEAAVGSSSSDLHHILLQNTKSLPPSEEEEVLKRRIQELEAKVRNIRGQLPAVLFNLSS